MFELSGENILSWQDHMLKKMADHALDLGDIELYTTLETMIMLNDAGIVDIEWVGGEPTFKLSPEYEGEKIPDLSAYGW